MAYIGEKVNKPADMLRYYWMHAFIGMEDKFSLVQVSLKETIVIDRDGSRTAFAKNTAERPFIIVSW